MSPEAKSKNGAVGLPTYDFLLVFIGNQMFICHRLDVIAITKILLQYIYLLELDSNFGPPTPTLTSGGFYSSLVKGKSCTKKMKLITLMLLIYFATDTWADGRIHTQGECTKTRPGKLGQGLNNIKFTCMYSFV